MEYTESARHISERVMGLLRDEVILSKAAFIFLCCACLFLLVTALIKRVQRRWESTYYVLLCASVFLWSGCSLVALLARAPETAETLNAVRNIGIIPIPALLCLHIKQQVSYKEQKKLTVGLAFVIPLFLAAVVVRDSLYPLRLVALPSSGMAEWNILIFYLYSVFAFIRAYLLCFDVLYQMPKRTRRSTRYMLVGVSAMAVLVCMDALWEGRLSVMVPGSDALDILLPLGAPAAFCFLLYTLYNALYVMPASDVIVTSRELVVGSIETTILVLNRKKSILDWNRKDWEAELPLPKPLYREPYEKYRKRLLELSGCRVSPLSDDIIILQKDEKEIHFLFRSREVGNSRRSFGSVLEITEISPLYTLLRYFEEIAYYDTLTGLHNRNAYLDRVKVIMDEKNMPLLIFVGDVNYLKIVNDTYGHILGDHLLNTVADIIKRTMPEGAFAARVGGDEFVLLIPGGDDDLAKRFVKDVITLCESSKHEVYGSPSISWGYAVMTSAEQSYNDAFEEADAMMYEYKKARHGFRSSGLMPEA